MAQEKNISYWENYRDGIRYAHGPKETFPDAKDRKMFRDDGYKLMVNGTIYKEEKK